MYESKKYPILLKNGILTFSYGTGLSTLPSRGIALINRALKEWSCRLNIYDTLGIISNQPADIIAFQPDSSSGLLMETAGKASFIPGNFYFYLTSTNITINKNATFDYSYPDNYIYNSDFYESILHELGHALGLEHINDSLSLMYYANSYENFHEWNNRIDLRSQKGGFPDENPADSTNAVKDANYIVKRSENDTKDIISGKLTASVPSSCSPVAPANLKSVVKGAGKIILSWKSASDMDYYTLTRTDNSGNNVILTLPDGDPIGAGDSIYIDTLVKPSSIYTYKLVSINSFGRDSSITKPDTTMALAQPSIKQANSTTSNIVTITWTGNANTYTILRSSDGGQTYAIIAKNDTLTSYTDSTVIPGTKYFYELQGNINSTDTVSNPYPVTACLSTISNTTFSTSTIIYPCSDSIKFQNVIIEGKSNVRVNGSSNKVNIQGKFQVQKGSSFYAK